MPSYLIELSHDDEHTACVRALDALAQYGSHFITHANWGCRAGNHSGWLVAELDDEEEALRLVPPPFRSEARITEVEHFTREHIAELIEHIES